MAARYAFWRKPDGTPYTGTDDKFAPTRLLHHIGVNATVSGDGVSWPLAHEGYETAVTACVTVVDPEQSELSSGEVESLVWSAIIAQIRKLGGGRAIASHELLKDLNHRASEYFRQPVNDYVYVTSLSLSKLPARRISIGGCVIRPLSDRTIFELPKCIGLLDRTRTVGKAFENSQYPLIRVDVKGRSTGNATSKAVFAIDSLRGIWNLFATYRSSSIKLSGVRYEGVGKIYCSCVGTLHHPNGPSVADTFWYDFDLPDEHELFPKWNESHKIVSIEKGRHWVMQQLRILPFGNELRTVFARYARALDHTNLDLACLQLWAILEKLTDTVGKAYDDTIKRTLWDYDEPEVAKHLLHFLRLRRNIYVHASESAGDRQRATYLLKDFVDQHVMVLLRNDCQVTNLREYGEFLSQPHKISDLEAIRDRASLAIQLRATASPIH